MQARLQPIVDNLPKLCSRDADPLLQAKAGTADPQPNRQDEVRSTMEAQMTTRSEGGENSAVQCRLCGEAFQAGEWPAAGRGRCVRWLAATDRWSLIASTSGSASPLASRSTRISCSSTTSTPDGTAISSRLMQVSA